MEIQESRENDILVFSLEGRLDSNTSPGFDKRIFEAIQNGSNKIIVDFERLDYISSAGLRVILKAAKELKQKKGAIVFCSMKEYVKEVFEISGFDSFLNIVPEMADARSSI